MFIFNAMSTIARRSITTMIHMPGFLENSSDYSNALESGLYNNKNECVSFFFSFFFLFQHNRFLAGKSSGGVHDNSWKTISNLVAYDFWSMRRSVEYDVWSKKNSQSKLSGHF